MDVHSADNRSNTAAAKAARARNPESAGVFQGVMQLMASVASSQADRQDKAGSAEARANSDERSSDREDDRVDGNDDSDSASAESTAASQPAPARPQDPRNSSVVTSGPSQPETSDPVAETPVERATTPDAGDGRPDNPTASPEKSEPAEAASGPENKTPSPSEPMAGAQDPAAQAGVAMPIPVPNTPKPGEATDATVTTAATASAVAATAKPRAVPVEADAPPAVRPTVSGPAPSQAPLQTTAADSSDPSPVQRPAPAEAKPTATARADTPPASKPAAEPQAPNLRPDALQNVKVTVEPAVPVARSQGVSSAVLLQAQQAATGTNATPNTPPLHVGGNQPTFVGADAGTGANANTGGNSAGGNGAGNNTSNQGGSGTAGQQPGVGFGATIGQRGFGGDAARAQFQEILSARTGRTQPAALSSGSSTTPGALTSSTPTTMAGPGGPQSTLPASSVNRADSPAQGRPGANTGTVADQVAVKLSSTAKNGGSRVSIRLNPEELGKVDVKLDIGKDGLVRAMVTAEKPETLDLLQRDARALERALQEAGLKTNGDSLDFDLRGEDGRWAEDSNSNASDGADKTAAGNDDGDTVETGPDGSADGVRADGSLDLVA